MPTHKLIDEFDSFGEVRDEAVKFFSNYKRFHLICREDHDCYYIRFFDDLWTEIRSWEILKKEPNEFEPAEIKDMLYEIQWAIEYYNPGIRIEVGN
jgi:hypothetical protein